MAHACKNRAMHDPAEHAFHPLIERKLALLPQEARWRGDAPFLAKLGALAVASDFALATLASQPDLAERLHADAGAAP